MKTIEIIDQVKTQTQVIINEVHSEFNDIDKRLLQMKPGPDKWSIIECFEHLNYASEYYLDQFEDIVKRGEKASNSDQNYTSGALGNWVAKSMKPAKDGSIKNKMKTFRSLDPSLTIRNNINAIEDFLSYQEKYLKLLEEMKTINISSQKIHSMIRFLRLKVGDAIRFYTNHNERHVLQAKRVKEFFQELDED